MEPEASSYSPPTGEAGHGHLFSLLVSVVFALLVKANLFEVLSRLDAGVLIAGLGAGVVGPGSPMAGTDVIRVGAFNSVLMPLCRRAVMPLCPHALTAREFDPTDRFTVLDPDDRFEREPLVARFQAGGFDFRLVGVHIKPDDASDELEALAQVADAVADSTEGDVILLGDFSADCSYLNETDASHPFRAAAYHWVIGNDVETAVRSGCTYDRIVMLNGTFGEEYVPNSAQVFRYDREFGITDSSFVARVSDHFPMFADFRITGPDDDGPGGAVAQPVAATGEFVASSRGQFYYRAGCNAARRLSPANLVHFATAADAEQAGYRRSRASGC